jgi:hypothetical protein
MLDGYQPRSVCGAACGDGAAGGSNFGQTMFAVVARRLGGFVGVGYDTQREGPGLFAFDAAVWRSRNGTTWERVPPQNALRGPGNQAMKGITETSSGQLVAVGKNAGRAAVWTSATGDRWISVHSPDFAEPGYGLELNDVVEYRGELFAVGRDGYPDGTYNRAAVWVRPTGGGEWTRVAPDSFPRDGGIMRRVAVGPSGLVAVGRSNANGREVAAVWVSKNGRTWTRAESTSFAGVGDTAMNGVAAVSGPGLLAVGTGPTAGSSAGAQQDARVWRRR